MQRFPPSANSASLTILNLTSPPPSEISSFANQAWHGERELFDSHVTDWNYLGCVQGKCRVHTLEEYEALDSITQADFYQRFRYDPTSGHFDPDIVPVYCICEVPHNPDRDMVLCEHCKDWFHCDCVSFYPERNEEFFCPQVDCQEAKMARANKARAGAKLAKR